MKFWRLFSLSAQSSLIRCAMISSLQLNFLVFCSRPIDSLTSISVIFTTGQALSNFNYYLQYFQARSSRISQISLFQQQNETFFTQFQLQFSASFCKVTSQCSQHVTIKKALHYSIRLSRFSKVIVLEHFQVFQANSLKNEFLKFFGQKSFSFLPYLMQFSLRVDLYSLQSLSLLETLIKSQSSLAHPYWRYVDLFLMDRSFSLNQREEILCEVNTR